MTTQASTKGRRFQLILLKPSHYDDDGYVIRWWRAMIPSEFALPRSMASEPTARSARCLDRTFHSTSKPSMR